MKPEAVGAKVIKWGCEYCGKPNETEGSYHPGTFLLRFKYAVCTHCQIPRHVYKIEEGYFQCEKCNVIYRITKTWMPVKGNCMCCYMREYRKKKKISN